MESHKLLLNEVKWLNTKFNDGIMSGQALVCPQDNRHSSGWSCSELIIHAAQEKYVAVFDSCMLMTAEEVKNHKYWK